MTQLATERASVAGAQAARIPQRRDFKFLSGVNCRRQDQEAVLLLAEYADSAADFFHDRKGRHAVESLASARLFAEYTVTYVANMERITLAEFDASDDRVSFYDKVKNVRDALKQRTYASNAERETISAFPDLELRQIWEKAGRAVHPPKGIAVEEIRAHKRAYRDAARAALENALKIGQWLERRYGKLPWYKNLWRRIAR